MRLQQTLQNELHRRGIKKAVATVITQVLVDKEDPGFQEPRPSPLAAFMDEAEAKKREAEMGMECGRRCRARLAACSCFAACPKKWLNWMSVKTLLDAGVTVITVGGGGIPVIDQGNREFTGTPQ